MLSDAFARFVVGPIGSGKTTALIFELLRRSVEQQPDPKDGIRYTRFVVVRNTLQMLRQTIQPDVEQLLRPLVKFKVSESKLEFRFNDVHSDWLFVPLESTDDIRRLLSLQLTGAWCSEFCELDYDIIAALMGRIGRYPSRLNGGPTWQGLIAESNTGTEDSKWYEVLKLDCPDNWALFEQPGGLDPEAENTENLPDHYYDRLLKGHSDDWIERYVHGRWGKSLSGQAVFRASFDETFHGSRTALKPVPGYPLLIGLDFGRTPTALIGQVDQRGRLLVFQELTSEDMGLEQFADTALRGELHHRRFSGFSHLIVADPAGRVKSQLNEETAFEVLDRLGYTAQPAVTNKIDPRLRAVEQYFLRQQDRKAALLIDRGSCPKLVQAMTSRYRYKRSKDGQLQDNKPEKLHPWSDLADCLQYMALAAQGGVVQEYMHGADVEEYNDAPPLQGWI